MEQLIASFRNSNFLDAMMQELLSDKIKAEADITATKIKAEADIRAREREAEIKSEADIRAREREAKIKAEADIAKTKIKEEAGIRKSRIKANHVHFPLFPTVFLVYFFNRLALFIFFKTDYIGIPIFSGVLGFVTVLVDLLNISSDPSANTTLTAVLKAIAVVVLSSFYVFIRNFIESTIYGDGDCDPEREDEVDESTRYVLDYYFLIFCGKKNKLPVKSIYS